jgi:hypothetical protein
MRHWIPLLALAPLAAACAAEAPHYAPAAHVPVPSASERAAGLDQLLGRNAHAVTTLLGQPNADVTEGLGRKMQFAGAICVLDAYLYKGSEREPVVTFIDARQRNGGPIDKASCLAALTKRGGK